MIFFTYTNSVDPDETQHYAAFHLGLRCLQMYSFISIPNAKDKIQIIFIDYIYGKCSKILNTSLSVLK